eukprot:364225-Chlamydomonas_euryale.AAC.3
MGTGYVCARLRVACLALGPRGPHASGTQPMVNECSSDAQPMLMLSRCSSNAQPILNQCSIDGLCYAPHLVGELPQLGYARRVRAERRLHASNVRGVLPRVPLHHLHTAHTSARAAAQQRR